MSDPNSGAAASIGSVFSHPYDLVDGAQLVDPTSDGINHRVKGLFTYAMNGESLIMALHRLSELTRDLDVSRASFRFLIRHADLHIVSQIAPVPWKPGTYLQFEALVPVHGHPTVGGIAYFGTVTQERQPSPETSQAERALRIRADSVACRKPFDTARTERLIDASDADIDRLVELYHSSFDAYLVAFTRETVRAMVSGGITFVVRVDGVIQSIALAEQVMVQPTSDAFDPGPAIPFYEVTEVATDIAHRGQGHAHRLYCAVIEAVLAIASPIPAVIITEIRAAWGPLHFLMVKTGFAQVGYMPAHCAIKSSGAEDVPQAGIYGDLAVCCYTA